MAEKADSDRPRNRAPIGEAASVVRRYVIQETVAPLRQLGRRLVFGLAGACLIALGAVVALFLGRRRGIRFAPTWTCGSTVTTRSQYTATAFSKPIRRIFGFVLFPERQKISDLGVSRWFPTRIRYEVTTRDVIDEGARNIAAFVQRLARRARILQAGLLRIYLVYAVVAVLVVLVVAR